jgi:RimJ/RimL family protein N-acetyltransferase
MTQTKIADFAALHLPALVADEVRYNLMIASLRAAIDGPPDAFETWTLGEPGHCALHWPGRPVLLGDLTPEECHRLADLTRARAYSGVFGSDRTATRFVERATVNGHVFAHEIAMRLSALDVPPLFPGVVGALHCVETADAAQLAPWMSAFHREAVPHDPAPTPTSVTLAAANGRFFFWRVDGVPVAMAAIARNSPSVMSISWVYTPPDLRGRGYAGSVVAAIAERAFADGRQSVCLYIDRANPASNRCYAKIGFKPYCDAAFIQRVG